MCASGSQFKVLQWNLSNMDTIGTKIFVLINEVSLFQGENNTYLNKVWTLSSILINQVSLFQGCPLREVPLYAIIIKTFEVS